ncbi:HEPN domain-containing protein [Pseudonocardia xinjiangensis]|uniref:HEPN domain-containing protein n=1 Tax=Pseudonocardia xinjiangensis TaxID=75289 RepID=UPI003D8ADF24
MTARAPRLESIDDARHIANSLKQDLDSTYKRYLGALSADMPINFQGDVHKYMCIRLSGFLEQLVHVAITGMVRSKAHPTMGRFALSYFRHAPNLNPKSFEALIERFGEPLEESLKLFLDQDARRDLLGNLLEVRNKTAHGDNYKGSKPNVDSYKRLVDEIYNWVISDMLA